MLAWTSATWGQRPSDADAAAVIKRSRQKALDYARSLPDFMCNEVIRRYALNPRGIKHTEWAETDTLTIMLRYLQQVEEHKLQLINGKPTDRKYEDLEGLTGAGEFGGVLRVIFDPASKAVFAWGSWKNVRKHRIAVYEYAVSAAHWPYSLQIKGLEAEVGIHGVLEIERETGEVLHFTYMAYGLPKGLDLESAVSSVDYDFSDVGGREYLLPRRSDTELHSVGVWVRNQIDFQEYHKFSADSVIDFGHGK